jgi:RNA polymerase sigma factor (sigma-70 family)
VQPIARLHRPITEDGGLLADMVQDEQAAKPEELIAADQLHEHLEACLARLSAREASVIRLRYGLETDHAHTLREIAEMLGLSRERVRQIEKIAFEKLRQPQPSEVLADFADVA